MPVLIKVMDSKRCNANGNSTREEECLEILGVKSTDTEAEIRLAYKRLASQYHPKANKNKNARYKFQEISLAYRKLTQSEVHEEDMEEDGAVPDEVFFAMFESMFGEGSDLAGGGSAPAHKHSVAHAPSEDRDQVCPCCNARHVKKGFRATPKHQHQHQLAAGGLSGSKSKGRGGTREGARKKADAAENSCLQGDREADEMPSAPSQMDPPEFADVTKESIELTWAKPDTSGFEVTEYILEMSVGKDSRDFKLVYEGKCMRYMVPRLLPGSIYSFRARSRTLFGEGPFSEIITQTTLGRKPDASQHPDVMSNLALQRLRKKEKRRKKKEKQKEKMKERKQDKQKKANDHHVAHATPSKVPEKSKEKPQNKPIPKEEPPEISETLSQRIEYEKALRLRREELQRQRLAREAAELERYAQIRRTVSDDESRQTPSPTFHPVSRRGETPSRRVAGRSASTPIDKFASSTAFSALRMSPSPPTPVSQQSSVSQLSSASEMTPVSEVVSVSETSSVRNTSGKRRRKRRHQQAVTAPLEQDIMSLLSQQAPVFQQTPISQQTLASQQTMVYQQTLVSEQTMIPVSEQILTTVSEQTLAVESETPKKLSKAAARRLRKAAKEAAVNKARLERLIEQTKTDTQNGPIQPKLEPVSGDQSTNSSIPSPTDDFTSQVQQNMTDQFGNFIPFHSPQMQPSAVDPNAQYPMYPGNNFAQNLPPRMINHSNLVYPNSPNWNRPGFSSASPTDIPPRFLAQQQRLASQQQLPVSPFSAVSHQIPVSQIDQQCMVSPPVGMPPVNGVGGSLGSAIGMGQNQIGDKWTVPSQTIQSMVLNSTESWPAPSQTDHSHTDQWSPQNDPVLLTPLSRSCTGSPDALRASSPSPPYSGLQSTVSSPLSSFSTPVDPGIGLDD
eukprot:474086_1